MVTMILASGCTQPKLTPEVEPVTQLPSEPSPSELIIVYDNNPFDSRLKTAWGFSCLVKLPQTTILFDTGGDSSTLLYNMSRLRVDPGEVEEWMEIGAKPVWEDWVAEMQAKGLPGQKVLDEALRLMEKYK